MLPFHPYLIQYLHFSSEQECKNHHLILWLVFVGALSIEGKRKTILLTTEDRPLEIGKTSFGETSGTTSEVRL